MNIWECQHPECTRTCVGAGGAVGLRALGWYFEPGPGIYCPEHRPDANSDDCSQCIADIWAFRYQHAIDPTSSHIPVLALDHAKHGAESA